MGSSGPGKLGEPFGFLKGSSANSNVVNLCVLPYAFTKLWPLLGIFFFIVFIVFFYYCYY